MDIALLSARLVLSAVFLLAGLTKLAAFGASRQTLADFGVPAPLVTPVGALLPIVEVVVALAVIPVSTTWWGAAFALALLVIFSVGVSVNLIRGRAPACRCFGQLSSSPIRWSTVARNIGLCSIAGLILWEGWSNPGPSAIAWLSDLSPAQRVGLVVSTVALALLAGEAMVLLQMLQQQGRILLRLDALDATLTVGRSAAGEVVSASTPGAAGLPVGSPAPSFRLDGLLGETLTLDALLAAGKPVLLVFTDPRCGPCQSLLPDVARWHREHAEVITIALISERSVQENQAKSAEHGVTQVLLQKRREVSESYRAYGTPGAVLVRPDGIIGSPLALGTDAVRALVTHVLRLGAAAVGPVSATIGHRNGVGDGAPAVAIRPKPKKVGEQASNFELPDLDGRMVRLSQFLGHETLVLFWNPSCGFCQQMVTDLRAWEATRSPQAPTLLVISTGTVQDNRALGLRAPVLLDQAFQTASAFGAHGSPMGVLIDAAGRIASEVAAGAQAVLALATQSPSSIA